MDNIRFTSLLSPLLSPGEPPVIAVAVSGGADSLALAYLLYEWSKKQGAKIVALTVNHNFRPEAEEEAATVHEWLAAEGIEHHILTHQGKKPDANLMEAARELRYHLLISWCNRHDIRHLAVAHHLDDQAETFLLRLERGSGVDGLAAMSPVSARDGIKILRPLLSVPRREIEDYLQERGKIWISDPTNADTKYKRNRLRKMLEELPGKKKETLTKRLSDTARTMRRAREALEDYTAQAMAECVEFYPDDHASLDKESWRFYPEEIRLRVLASLLRSIGGAEKPIRFEKLERLHDALLSNDIMAVTLAGCKVEGKGVSASIRREQE